MERFALGTKVSVAGEFRPAGSDIPQDPAGQISITVRRPDASTTSLPADRLAQGRFGGTLLLDQPGRWAVRIASLGEVAAESEFFVQSSVVI